MRSILHLEGSSRPWIHSIFSLRNSGNSDLRIVRDGFWHCKSMAIFNAPTRVTFLLTTRWHLRGDRWVECITLAQVDKALGQSLILWTEMSESYWGRHWFLMATLALLDSHSPWNLSTGILPQSSPQQLPSTFQTCLRAHRCQRNWVSPQAPPLKGHLSATQSPFSLCVCLYRNTFCWQPGIPSPPSPFHSS